DINIAGLTIAIIVTFTRLGIRIRSRKLGWDDFWAAASVIGAALLMTGVLIILDPQPWMTQATLVAGYYITSEGFYIIVWTSRLSILFTIIRISPISMRKVLYTVAGAFGLMWIFLGMQEIVICEREPGWKAAVPTQCHLGKQVAIAQLTTDLIADLSLLIVPVHLFWSSLMPAGQRMRLNLVFSTCFLTTIVSLVHAYWIFANRGLNEIFTGIFEVSISMIVSSLSVIVGFAYRCLSQDNSPTLRPTTPQIQRHSHATNGAPISVDIKTTIYTDLEAGKAASSSQQGLDDDGSVYDRGCKLPAITQLEELRF
ncbi:hypothetical protein GYMLUDRAFT_177833, partial [Collybiopsis luxurians FD-317 M1]